MPSCSVKWCVNHTSTCSFKSNKGVSFHRFPRNEILRQKWVDAVRLERRDPWWTSTKASRICSMHFRDSDMTSTPCKVNVLSKTAVPVCTMVWYENENNISSNLSHDFENAKVYNDSTRTYETKRSLSEVLKETKINILNDKESANQEAEKAFENIKMTQNQQLNGYHDTNGKKSAVLENEEKEKSFCIIELNTKYDAKINETDTFIKLNEKTNVILKKNHNNETALVEKYIEPNIESQIPNSNTCKTNNIVKNNKEPDTTTSDETITDLGSEDIKNLDLKYTFVAKILKTYLPKRKYTNKPCLKTISRNCNNSEEYQSLDLKNHNNNKLPDSLNSVKANTDMCMQSIIKENILQIQNNTINGKDSTINTKDVCYTSICEKLIVDKNNVNEGKEQENTDYNDENFDLVGKSKIASKEPEKEIYTKTNENMCIEPSTYFCVESSSSHINNFKKTSNPHLILDLDTNIFTETNDQINVDNSEEYCEITHEQNNKMNGVNGITFTTGWIDSGVGIEIYDHLNVSTHTNELSLIDSIDPKELNDNLNLESEYNLLAKLNRDASDCIQNRDILNDNSGFEEDEILNLETSENFEIGMENLQFEVELNSLFNRLHPETSKENFFGNLESSLSYNHFEEIGNTNIPEKALYKPNDVEEFQILTDGVKGKKQTPEKTLENIILLEEEAGKISNEASSNTSEENREVVFNLNKANPNLSMSLNLYNDMYASKKILMSSLNDGTTPKILQKNDPFPEQVKHFSEKSKMDSLAELCKNMLIAGDKEIYYNYSNMALKNKKTLQDVYGYNNEELDKNIGFDIKNIVKETENNIDVSEKETQLNFTSSDHSKSKLDGTIITSCSNFSKSNVVGGKITDSEPNTTVLSELIENELQSTPEHIVNKSEKDETKVFCPSKDLNKLCGKSYLDFKNMSPISTNKFVDEEMEVIESNMDIDKENSSEFDISLLDGDSITDSGLENLDNNSNSNLGSNEKDSSDELMDIRPDDIPESIDAILDEEGSLFENLDLLEEDSQESNKEIANECTELNSHNSKITKEISAESNFDQLLESFANDNINSTALEKSENSIRQIKSKIKHIVEKCLDKPSFESDITYEKHGLNIDEMKKQYLDEFSEQKTKGNENNFDNNHLMPSKVKLQGKELKNKMYPAINEPDRFKCQENEGIFNHLKHLENVLFKSTPFTNELESQNCGSNLMELENNKNDDASILNKIAYQKGEVILRQEPEQEKELFNCQNDLSNIDEIFDNLCKPHAKIEKKIKNDKEVCDLITKKVNIQLGFKEQNEGRVLKDFHNENIEMSQCGRKDIDTNPIEQDKVQSDKLGTERKYQCGIEQLKTEFFSQCFSPDCSNNCMKAQRKTSNNNIQRFKNQNIDFSNQSQIKKRQRRFNALYKKQRRNNNQSISENSKKQKNKSNCGSSSNEKLKLKYKEFSIDLLRGQCFEFSQKGNEGETNLGHKEFKRKNSETNLEQRKIKCTESMIAKNKYCQSIEISLNKNNLIDNETRNDDCTKSREPMEECPKCGYVIEDENCDVDLNVTEPLSVINKDMLLSGIEKKNDGNDENKKVPLRSVYAMELAYVTAIQALQKKLRKKMAVCDYRLRKMNNLIKINNRLIKDNISLKCNTNVV